MFSFRNDRSSCLLMNELTLGFSSAVGRVFIDVNCVDDSDDDCIDRQLFGFVSTHQVALAIKT